jgi:predicted molibdopterin-dependent oxidoreductase YjgC
MTNSIREIEGMEVIFIIGSNTKETHPVIANRMIKAQRAGAKIIVADPRRVPMVKFAEVFLRMRPGTDAALLNGIAHVIVSEGLQNEEFIRERTKGFEEWQESLREFTPERVQEITGVPQEELVRAARLYGRSRRAGLFYTMGITQHACGTDNVRAIANLATLTGNIGRESTGVNPLRGQNNVQGASDAACLPNVYPGYQRVDLPEVRAKFEQAWGVTLSGKPGLTATEMMEAALTGKLKALYVMGENPIMTDPNIHHTVRALESVKFLVVQDIFLTETAKMADVVLPAACSFEKEGTFTNTERRVQRVRRAVRAPGEARDDLSILMDLARALRYPMTYASPAEVF